MKTHNNLYKELCSKENIFSAYKRARKGKSKTKSVIKFNENLFCELDKLREELISKTYIPLPLKRFIVRDPKTRTIHASAFRDRIVHHLIVNMLKQVYERKFIYDSFASRKNKGTHPAVRRFDKFKQKVSNNGKLIKKAIDNNSIKGYILKADIKKYFDNVNHEILLTILRQKIKDEDFILLVKKVLENFKGEAEGKGMPLGNYTSQFFANVYLNKLDYFIKHTLKARFYIRYVDDFVIFHKSRKRLEYFKERIIIYLKCLKLELHSEKSKITPLKNGTQFLGYRIFYHYKLLRKRNIKKLKKKIDRFSKLLSNRKITKEEIIENLQGWFGYAKWANTYKLREEIKNT